MYLDRQTGTGMQSLNRHTVLDVLHVYIKHYQSQFPLVNGPTFILHVHTAPLSLSHAHAILPFVRVMLNFQNLTSFLTCKFVLSSHRKKCSFVRSLMCVQVSTIPEEFVPEELYDKSLWHTMAFVQKEKKRATYTQKERKRATYIHKKGIVLIHKTGLRLSSILYSLTPSLRLYSEAQPFFQPFTQVDAQEADCGRISLSTNIHVWTKTASFHVNLFLLFTLFDLPLFDVLWHLVGPSLGPLRLDLLFPLGLQQRQHNSTSTVVPQHTITSTTLAGIIGMSNSRVYSSAQKENNKMGACTRHSPWSLSPS